jgi:hypothetical protein
MPDSEGTWELGVITGADFALTDFGQYSPTAAEDTWAAAATSVQPVVGRAENRLAQQVAELAAGERPFTLGVMVGDGKLLTAGENAAETAIDDVRIRRPVEMRCSYDGGVTTGILYPRLAVGAGSDASVAIESAVIVGADAMRLKTVIVNCVGGVPGLTDIRLETVPGVLIAVATAIDLASGINTIDFLTEAGAHTITAGDVVALYLDTTAAHDVISLLLLFEEVPA